MEINENKTEAEMKEIKKENKTKKEISKKDDEILTVNIEGKTYTGLVTCRRTINKGEQVFLKLKNDVSRWFNTIDIV